MKKIISTILAFAMIITMVNIPVAGADDNEVSAVNEVSEVSLITVEEDFTQYSSLDDINHFVYENDTHATVEIVEGTGLVIKQTDSTPLDNGEVNKTVAPKIGYVIEGSFNEDAEKRTSYRINRFSGKYKMTVDFEVSSDKHPEPVEGVTITNPYYAWNIGGVESPEELTPSVKGKLFFRVGSNYVNAYNSSSSGSSTMESSNVKFTAGEQHQLVMDVDTETKEVSVNVDNYKTPATGSMASAGYINAFYIAGMERMLVDSHFTIKKIKLEQQEANASTTAALTALNAIPELVADPYAVTDDIALPSSANIEWTSSDESVIDATGKVTRGAEDKDVTITATYKNGDVILYKDYVLTVKKYVAPPTQAGGLISVEEDFTQYSSLDDIPYFVYDESDHTTISVESGKGLVIKHIKSTPVSGDTYNTNLAAKIAHVVEGTFNEDTAKRTSYRINRYAGKYKITMDFESSNEKYTEPVDGVTINNPYYLLTMGGISTPSNLTTSVGAKYTARVFSTSAVLYSASANATVKFTEGEPHRMVMEVDTATKNVLMNVDDFKTPAAGTMKSDGYINGFSLSGMERMKDNSFFAIKKIKIEQTESDADTAAALNALDAIADPTADPYAVTDDVTLSKYDNITWSSSDEAVIDAAGKVTRGKEDKDVIITATYKNGNVILYKDYVFTVKGYTDIEIAAADVAAIDLKLGDSVIKDITLPQTGSMGTTFVWASSHPEVIDEIGKVTRAEEDTTVTLTVTGTYGNQTSQPRMITVFVPKKDAVVETPVYDELIYVEEDFTQYSSISEIPYFAYAKTTHATVEAIKGKGLVVTQKISSPLAEDAVNKEQVPNISHVVEGTFNVDDENRTAYRIGRFAGKYRMVVDYEVKCDTYTEEVDGITISAPYYCFYFGSVPIPSSLTTAIQETVYMRVKKTSVASLGSISSNAFTPGSVKYTDGEPHQLVMEFDTLTRQATVNVDNNKTPSKGYLEKPGYINAFYIAGMERMQVGSYFLLKKISFQQLEEDKNTTAALNALAELPDTLADDPFAVTADITLPAVSDKITWSTSDASIISETGKITRWYADRDVVITATYADYDTVISKEYKLTVKELDNYVTSEIFSKSGKELDFVEIVGDTSKGETSVSDSGITVVKTVGGTDADAKDMPVYYADYRLYGEDVAYDDLTRASVSTAGYSGIYDVSFRVTPDIAGDKPVYVALGNKAGTFAEIASISVKKDGIAVSYEKGVYDVVSEETTGKTYEITFRVDTDQKKVWIYVDGKLAGTYFTFSKVDIIDSLRVVLDENNALNDKVVINNIAVTEISGNVIDTKQLLVSMLGRLSVDDITSNPDTVETINTLPEKVNDYEIIWSSSSKLIDLENGTVYHGEEGQTVVVSATIGRDGVYGKKDFYLYVRAANSGEEKIAYYLSDLAEVITNQNVGDIRYDLNLPAQHNGIALNWSSSNSEIIDVNGKINKSVAITKETNVVLAATVTFDGSTYTRTFEYTVSPRAYERVIYSGSGAPEAITLNGVENIAVACTNITNIKFKQAGNGSITFEDADGDVIAAVNVSDNLYSISYGDGNTVDYPISSEKTVNLDVMIMPDIDRIAVWADGELVVDFGRTLADVSDISSVKVVGGVEVTETKITTDEYGVLDLNVANAGYFDVFERNAVKDNVTLVTDTVVPADVQWKSSDSSLINAETGVVTVPDEYKFVDMTLTLTSVNDSAVKRTITKKVAVACDESKNLAKGVAVSSDATSKPGYSASNLTDGKLDTAYGTSYANRNPVITLDFGKETYVNTLYINEDFTKYDKSLKSYTIAYSNDGSKWTTVKNGSVTDAESALISFDAVYARYLSVTVTECERYDLYINEIEAYLFAEPTELVRLDVEQIALDLGYSVTKDIDLPENGQFGSEFIWKSSHPEVISADGKVTQANVNTNVTLTVTGHYGDATYTRTFSVYVPAKSVNGAKPVGGSGGGGGGSAGGGIGTSQLPGFVETNIKDEDEQVTEPEVTTSLFDDLAPTHWAYENVMKLKELGIIDGVGNNKFDLSGKVTREQFLKMLVMATGVEIGSTDTAFKDVDENAWYAPYVAAGVKEGLINGITPETFGVYGEITRQDMAVMIVRILDKNNIPVTETSEIFDDDENISDYAKDAVYKVRDAGIVQGYGNEFNPKASLTRAEAATVIIKMLEKLQ